MAEVIGVGSAILLTVAGLFALRYAWADPKRGRRAVAAGWAILGLPVLGWLAVAAGDKAIAVATLAVSVVALLIVGGGADVERSASARRPRRDAVELTGGSGRRRLARTLLAGPLAAAASVALGTAVSLHAPLSEANRLIGGGFVVPLAWAALGGWALADDRLRLVAGVLIGVALVGGAGMCL